MQDYKLLDIHLFCGILKMWNSYYPWELILMDDIIFMELVESSFYVTPPPPPNESDGVL